MNGSWKKSHSKAWTEGQGPAAERTTSCDSAAALSEAESCASPLMIRRLAWEGEL